MSFASRFRVLGLASLVVTGISMLTATFAWAQTPAAAHQPPIRRVPQTARVPRPPSAQRQVPVAPQAPFQLTPDQQAAVDQILGLWQRESDQIKSFKCPFERWVYDGVFGPGANVAATKSVGHLKYVKPDKGLFRVTEIRHHKPASDPNQPPTWEPKEGEHGEHWVCDGTAIYEYRVAEKRLKVIELPPELRGQAITNSPLPFLFGAEKDKLKARYFIRVTQSTSSEIWLEAYPRLRENAGEFKRAEIILNREKFLPSALQLYMANDKTREVYIFKIDQSKVNDPLERFIGAFQQPRTPFGWKKEIQRVPSQSAPRRQEPTRQAFQPSGRRTY